MSHSPRAATISVHWSEGDLPCFAPITREEWKALTNGNPHLAWALFDPCTFLVEESIREDWRSMRGKDRQARYAEHRARRELRTEAVKAKTVRL